jgi:uncharacterized membrane protein YbaN (DUF454 family)
MNIKKVLWMVLGFVCLGISYIGIVTPGIPWSTPAVGAAYCFAKSSKRWHDWIMNHKLFGPFIRNWNEKRIFPNYAKWAMVLTMDSSLVILWFTTYNWKLVVGLGVVMFFVALWALKYPGSLKEWQLRVDNNKKINWFS